MLNVKKMLTKLIQMVSTKDLTFTRINNSYVNATDFGRINGKRIGNVGVINFNFVLSASLPNGTTVDFGKIDNVSLPNQYTMCIPCQANNTHVMVSISSSGTMSIYNGCGTPTGANWFRASIPIVISGGGYFLTRIMSTFSHLAERWWEYVERKENAYETNGESELLNRIAIGNRNSNRGKFGICGCSAAERKESDRLGRGYLCRDRFSEHGFVGVRDAKCRDKRINHESFCDNKNHNGLCEIYRSRFIATTSERGWAVC